MVLIHSKRKVINACAFGLVSLHMYLLNDDINCLSVVTFIQLIQKE